MGNVIAVAQPSEQNCCICIVNDLEAVGKH